jgi:hypothetical protein
MPEIARLFGIVVKMYYRDHPPPHFHAFHGEENVMLDLCGEVLSGRFPPGSLMLLRNWVREHQAELLENWHFARAKKPMKRIAPWR